MKSSRPWGHGPSGPPHQTKILTEIFCPAGRRSAEGKKLANFYKKKICRRGKGATEEKSLTKWPEQPLVEGSLLMEGPRSWGSGPSGPPH